MDNKEITASVGLVLIIAGVSMIYVPAALILSGLMLFAYAFMTMRPVAKGQKEPS